MEWWGSVSPTAHVDHYWKAVSNGIVTWWVSRCGVKRSSFHGLPAHNNANRPCQRCLRRLRRANVNPAWIEDRWGKRPPIENPGPKRVGEPSRLQILLET